MLWPFCPLIEMLKAQQEIRIGILSEEDKETIDPDRAFGRLRYATLLY